MRLLVVTSSYPVSSARHAGIFVQRNVAALRDLGLGSIVLRPGPAKGRDDVIEPAHRVVEATVRSKSSGAFLRRGIPEEMKSNPLRTAMDLVRCTFSMHREVSKEIDGVDCVLAHWAFPAGFVVNRVFGRREVKIPFALWCHSSDVYAMERFPFGKGFARFALRHVDQFLVPSLDLSRRLKFLMGRDIKVEVLHPGINSGPEPTPLPSGELKVLFLGRLEPVKGVELIPVLAARNPHWSFNIVGSGSLEGKLKKDALQLKNLDVQDAIAPEAVRACLDAHHVLVLPGPPQDSERTEGLPTVILEAFDAGRPVIAGNTGGCSEVVDGKVGFLVPSGDLDACQKSLEKLAQDPEGLRGKSEAARTRSKGYDSVEVAKKIKRLLLNPS